MTDYTKLKATIEALDCGAHGCIYAMSPGGMRTNGGCHCLSHAPADVRMRVTGLVTLLRAEIEALRVERDALIAALRDAWAEVSTVDCDARTLHDIISAGLRDHGKGGVK
jgi:hypothetical protein